MKQDLNYFLHIDNKEKQIIIKNILKMNIPQFMSTTLHPACKDGADLPTAQEALSGQFFI